MKRCPFCAEEMDAARVCKHCGREFEPPLAALPTRSHTWVLWVLGVIVVGVTLIGLLAALGGSASTNNGQPLLPVSGGKGNLGFSLTNRDVGPISDCIITLLDQGDAEWVARAPRQLAPSEIMQVAWSSFTANGQPMPSYIGRNRDNFIVSCVVNELKTRRSVGLSF